MTLNQMLAAFELIIVDGVDNPTAKQIAEHMRLTRRGNRQAKRIRGGHENAGRKAMMLDWSPRGDDWN